MTADERRFAKLPVDDTPPTDRARWDELPNLERQYAAGDGRALMIALYGCARRRRPLPAWAAIAIEAGFLAVYDGKARSWDDVFSLPRAANKHVEKIGPRRALRHRIYDRIEKRSSPEAVGDGLFATVGKEFGAGARQVKELYYEQRAIYARPITFTFGAPEDPATHEVTRDGVFPDLGREFDPVLDGEDPDLPSKI